MIEVAIEALQMVLPKRKKGPTNGDCLPPHKKTTNRTVTTVKTYNDVYLAARKQLKESGIEAFALEARLIAGGHPAKQKNSL